MVRVAQPVRSLIVALASENLRLVFLTHIDCEFMFSRNGFVRTKRFLKQRLRFSFLNGDSM